MMSFFESILKGLAGGGDSNQFSLDNVNVGDLSIGDDAINNLLRDMLRNIGNETGSAINRNNELLARGDAPAGAVMSGNKAALSQGLQALTRGQTQLGSQQALSRIDAMKFLMGINLQKEQFDTQRLDKLLQTLAQGATLAAGVV